MNNFFHVSNLNKVNYIVYQYYTCANQNPDYSGNLSKDLNKELFFLDVLLQDLVKKVVLRQMHT